MGDCAVDRCHRSRCHFRIHCRRYSVIASVLCVCVAIIMATNVVVRKREREEENVIMTPPFWW